MTAPTVSDFKIFVPAKDWAISLAFYQALGAELQWRHGDGLAQLQLGGQRFLLQNFYAKEWAENFMIYLMVEDAAAWYDHAQALIASNKFPGIRAEAPKQMEWGDIVGYIWDPSGVLLHIAQDPPTD